MWWDGVMLGIESWQDLSAVIAIATAGFGAVAWLVRITVVKPLRSDIRELAKCLNYELALDSDEPMRDRTVRMDSEIVGLRGRVNRLEGQPGTSRS